MPEPEPRSANDKVGRFRVLEGGAAGSSHRPQRGVRLAGRREQEQCLAHGIPELAHAICECPLDERPRGERFRQRLAAEPLGLGEQLGELDEAERISGAGLDQPGRYRRGEPHIRGALEQGERGRVLEGAELDPGEGSLCAEQTRLAIAHADEQGDPLVLQPPPDESEDLL